MVHALHAAYKKLVHDGCLVSIQPRCIPHQVVVQSRGKSVQAGWFTDQEDYSYQQDAFDAITTVVAKGLFKLEIEQDFIYNIFSDDQNEFEEFLNDFWDTSSLTEKTSERISELIKDASSPVKIVLEVPVRMTKLRRV